MEINNQTNNDPFEAIPDELKASILNLIRFIDLFSVESTSKSWQIYIQRSQAWKNAFFQFGFNSVGQVPANFLWHGHVLQAKASTAILDVDNISAKTNDIIIRNITNPWKYYLKSFLIVKRYCIKDLEWIRQRSDLNNFQKDIAEELYWFVHMTMPNISQDLHIVMSKDIRRSHLTEELIDKLFPGPTQRFKDATPALFWELSGGHYTDWMWNFWIDEDGTVTLLIQEWTNYYTISISTIYMQKDVRSIMNSFPNDMVEKMPDSPTTYNLRSEYSSIRSPESNLKKFQEKMRLQDLFTEGYKKTIDKTAEFFLKSLADLVSLTVIKQYCDNYKLDDINIDKSSNSPKAAIIRCIRRITNYLLLDEVKIHWPGRETVGIFNQIRSEQLKYAKKIIPMHNTLTVHESRQKDWPLFLVHKAMVCCEPISKLLKITLLKHLRHETNENEQKIIEELTRLHINKEKIEQAMKIK